MHPILLYGHPVGSSTGLLAILEWLERPYQLCRVDMFGQMREPGYKGINARVETPVLITDAGDIVTETMAIAHWVQARDTMRRVTFDPHSREADRMWQLVAFVNTGFTAAFSPLWAALESKSDDQVFKTSLSEWGRRRVIERHDRLEEMIGNTEFLVGDRPTIADGVLMGVARWADFHGILFPTRWPKLTAWRNRIQQEPAVIAALAWETGEATAAHGSCRGHLEFDEVLSRFAESNRSV